MIGFILFLILGIFFLYVWAKLPSYKPYMDRTPEQQRNLRYAALFWAVVCLLLAFGNVVIYR